MMKDSLTKIIKSNSVIAILILVGLLAWIVNAEKNPPERLPSPSFTKHKSLEEIMATPVDTAQQAPWDKDFKSVVEPM
jgi:hypothetical protein